MVNTVSTNTLRGFVASTFFFLGFAVSNVYGQDDETIATQVPLFVNPNTSAPSIGPQIVRTVRFLTTNDFPPFNFIDPQGRLEGFNVSLARALCLEIKARCTLQTVAWDRLEEALSEGQGDAIIAGIKINKESLERLAFSSPYLRSPARFFTTKIRSSIVPDWTSVSGITLGVQKGTAHEAFARKHFPDNRFETYESQAELRDAVTSGSADAGFADGVFTSFWLQSARAKECCAFVGGPYINSDYFGAGYSIAVPRDREDLRLTLNNGLMRIINNGSYSEIYLRYFPVSFF